MPIVATREHIIRVHRDSPAKPFAGAVCNGCGVCCLAEPCPVGMVFSRRRTGACAVLRWDDETTRYRCGAIMDSRSLLPRSLQFLAPLLSRLSRRWVAAGTGCDSTLDAVRPASAGAKLPA